MVVIGDNRRRAAAQNERNRFGLVFYFALSMSMVVFSLYGAQASVFQKARATVLDFFEPVLAVFAGPAHWVNARAADAQEFLRLHDELERLRSENEDLRQYQDEVRSLRRQLSYFTDVNEAHMPPAAHYIDARVISESAGPYNRSLVLSAGANDQVREGHAVIDEAGLLGYVSVVGNRAARVVPLTDSTSRIPVVLLSPDGDGREVAQALLTGRSAGAPVLDVFSRHLEAPVVEGQEIVTSGAGGMMPRGIPIGEISSVRDGNVIVRLDANTTTPNFVRVVDFRFATDIDSTEDGTSGGQDGP